MNRQSRRENESSNETVEGLAIKRLEDKEEKSTSPFVNMSVGLVASLKTLRKWDRV
jgi:hypothetical protein